MLSRFGGHAFLSRVSYVPARGFMSSLCCSALPFETHFICLYICMYMCVDVLLFGVASTWKMMKIHCQLFNRRYQPTIRQTGNAKRNTVTSNPTARSHTKQFRCSCLLELFFVANQSPHATVSLPRRDLDIAQSRQDMKLAVGKVKHSKHDEGRYVNRPLRKSG